MGAYRKRKHSPMAMPTFRPPGGTSLQNEPLNLVRTFTTNVLVALLVVACIQNLLISIYRVPSSSMEETLIPGDRILVSRVAYVGTEPSNGDVIVFNADETWERDAANESNGVIHATLDWLSDVVGIGNPGQHTLVKRIVATPGQTISCCGRSGELLLDGDPLIETYVKNKYAYVPGVFDCETVPRSKRCFPEFTVPRGELVVLGDNRSSSSDSLYYCRGNDELEGCVRTVKLSDVQGKLFLIVAPLGRFGVPD